MNRIITCRAFCKWYVFQPESCHSLRLILVNILLITTLYSLEGRNIGVRVRVRLLRILYPYEIQKTEPGWVYTCNLAHLSEGLKPLSKVSYMYDKVHIR